MQFLDCPVWTCGCPRGVDLLHHHFARTRQVGGRTSSLAFFPLLRLEPVGPRTHNAACRESKRRSEDLRTEGPDAADGTLEDHVRQTSPPPGRNVGVPSPTRSQKIARRQGRSATRRSVRRRQPTPVLERGPFAKRNRDVPVGEHPTRVMLPQPDVKHPATEPRRRERDVG